MEREDQYVAQFLNILTDFMPLSLDILELVGRYLVTGKHAFLVFSAKFVIDNHYQLIKPRSRSRIWTTCSAIDRSRGVKVCIQKATKIFDDKIEVRQLLRETRLLRLLRRHENILSLLDLIPSPAGSPFDDVYVVTEYVDSDLFKVIRSKNALHEDHIHFLMFQLFSALKYCHAGPAKDEKSKNEVFVCLLFI